MNWCSNLLGFTLQLSNFMNELFAWLTAVKTSTPGSLVGIVRNMPLTTVEREATIEWFTPDY